VAAGLVWRAVVRGVGRRELLVLVVALGSVWMTAFGPATESNTYALLAGAAAVLAVGPRGSRLLAGVGYGLLAATVLRGLFPEDWRFQAYGPQPVGAMLLAVAAGWRVLASDPTRRLASVWFTRVTVPSRDRLAAPTVPNP
jgi:hypothetical protein